MTSSAVNTLRQLKSCTVLTGCNFKLPSRLLLDELDTAIATTLRRFERANCDI